MARFDGDERIKEDDATATVDAMFSMNLRRLVPTRLSVGFGVLKAAAAGSRNRKEQKFFIVNWISTGSCWGVQIIVVVVCGSKYLKQPFNRSILTKRFTKNQWVQTPTNNALH